MASPAPLLPPPKALRILPHKAATWFRVHPFDAATRKYAPAVFNGSGLGNARFSPLFDPVTGKPIPTIYAAKSERGAIAEIVLHDVPNPSAGYQHDLERDYRANLHLSRIRAPAARLVNMTTMGLQAAGLAPAHLFEGDKDDYAGTSEWAQCRHARLAYPRRRRHCELVCVQGQDSAGPPAPRRDARLRLGGQRGDGCRQSGHRKRKDRRLEPRRIWHLVPER